MAKVTWRQAAKDDPIFDGKFVVSSIKKSKQEMTPKKNTQQNKDGSETTKSTAPIEK